MKLVLHSTEENVSTRFSSMFMKINYLYYNICVELKRDGIELATERKVTIYSNHVIVYRIMTNN